MRRHCHNWTMRFARSAMNCAPNTCWRTILHNGLLIQTSATSRERWQGYRQIPDLRCAIGRDTTRPSRIENVWGGHSCPPLLKLPLILTVDCGLLNGHKGQVKGSGQECPPHTTWLSG